MYSASSLLRPAAIPYNYKLSQKRSIFADEMYSTICIEFWSSFDVNWSTFNKDTCKKRFFHYRYQWPWPL